MEEGKKSRKTRYRVIEEEKRHSLNPAKALDEL